MTKNQAKQIFDKYNPKEKVVRCPNGRAGVRKLLDSYAKAAVNLYGIIPIKELAEIFNSQNMEQTNVDEIFSLLLPVVLKEDKSSNGIYYCFYKDLIVHYLIDLNFDYVEFLLSRQKNKPRYIPEKNKFLKYQNDYYEEEIQKMHWNEVLGFLIDEFNDDPCNLIYDFYDKLKENSLLYGNTDFHRLLCEYDLFFSSEKRIQPFLDSLNNAHNNTRMWINKGHTPNELMEMRNKEYQKRGNEPIMIREHRKVGPNEPCPCGSGKKYKKAAEKGIITRL